MPVHTPPPAPVTVTTMHRFGPAMMALTDKQRAFIVAYNNAGNDETGGSAAAAAAGYSTVADGHRVTAHRLLHDPNIQAAMKEDINARFVGKLAQAFKVIDDIAQNPQNPQQLKAALTQLHHGGLIEKTLTEHRETITLTFEQKLERVNQLRAQLGQPVTTDAEYTENPPSATGLEDLI